MSRADSDKREENWNQGNSPAELLKQDAECLTVFLKQEGQDIGQWVKRLEEWEQICCEGAEGEEQLIELGLDLTSDQMMALSACYEQQGVLPAQDREYLMAVNTTPFDREDIMESEGHLLVFADGKPLPVQWTEETTLWKPEGIPPYGFRVFEMVQTEPEESTGTITLDMETLTLETPFYRVRWNEAMEFVSFLEKESGQELLPEGRTGNVLYADGHPVTSVVRAAVMEQGAVRTVVQVIKQVNGSYVIENLVFYEHSKRVDIQISCLWQEEEVPLELCFSYVQKGRRTAVIQGNGCCVKEEEAGQYMVSVQEEDAEIFLLPYQEENRETVYKEVCLIRNSAYQLAGQLPFRENRHSYCHVPEEITKLGSKAAIQTGLQSV
ncbi:MAG: hypothetical protein J6A77_00090 [Lachnospiraceae bacterium]|nr:hypothetical protein [Lachnospiraceae bacterium]